MSTGTITPYRAPRRTGNDGFWQLLHAEWTKFRTVRGWLIAVIIAAGLIVGVAALLPRGSNQCGSGSQSGAACLAKYPIGPGGEAVSDSYYFVRQPLAGNGTITVRVTSLTGMYSDQGGFQGGGQAPGVRSGLVPWAKAGIIITQSTKQGSAYAAMMVTGSHGVRMQYNYTSDSAGLAGAATAASPRWLRLTRSGDTITGYDSADGRRWTKVGIAHLSGLGSIVQAGLFATSPAYEQSNNPNVYSEPGGSTSPSIATGVFDHVSLKGAAAGAWTGQFVGDGGGSSDGPNGVFGKSTQPGFRHVGEQFTVTGYGDIAPEVAGDTGNDTISDHLFGVFIGLTIFLILAVLFITGEYRRGLIRTTLAASPRRGRVLAAKALVIGVVTFVLGTAAAALAVTIGLQLAHGSGIYVLPVSWLTELRVMAGVGALLALAAVFALSLGVILRRSAVAVGAAFLTIVLPYVLGASGALPREAAIWLLRVSPAAAFALEQSVPQYPQVFNQYAPPDYYPLAPWAGLAVLCAYAAGALGLALYLLRRRDA
ncbi:MAG TPA: ABC transporter permease subunit [Streptosporangiaceae bacterium]|nr:ABC transporter permease subunit [Streptosporangiaceae bacterium]